MDNCTAGASNIRFLVRGDILLVNESCNVPSIIAKIKAAEERELKVENYSAEEIKLLKASFASLKLQFKIRWLKAHRKVKVFIENNQSWIQGTFSVPKTVNRPGRPPKCFDNCSVRSKRRKTVNLRSSNGTKELISATRMKLRSAGMRDASEVLGEITSSPNRAHKYKIAYREFQSKSNEQLTILEALSMFVEANLTRRQYEVVRMSNKKIYPCYSIIQKAEKDCYPSMEAYRVSATCAEIRLQDLLNHTSTRLLQYLQEVIDSLEVGEITHLKLIYKWGCDGSQQSQYKQKFENESESDSNIFQCSLVPLQLLSTKSNKVIWKNPTPSSPRYCRPIRIRFVKESVDITNEEVNFIENAISTLEETQIELNGVNIRVQHTLLLTMVDAKVCNAVTNTTSTMECYICNKTSKDFNNLDKIGDINISSLAFGLSTLHARIRLFEGILHMSYKLNIMKWQARTEEHKNMVKTRKTAIQKEFKIRMGLIVDVPKPGFGNSNDGNTSRRFFSDPDVSAEITGVDRNLIFRLKVVLEVLTSGHKIDTEKFHSYATDTAKLYIELYPWYPMSPTMHKILVHGQIVIENALLPIGQLSEEAAEARNKHFRQYRESFGRKFSRESCNIDILNRLLLTSDPLLTGYRKKPTKPLQSFSKEALKMLLPADISEVCTQDLMHVSSESDDEEMGF